MVCLKNRKNYPICTRVRIEVNDTARSTKKMFEINKAACAALENKSQLKWLEAELKRNLEFNIYLEQC